MSAAETARVTLVDRAMRSRPAFAATLDAYRAADAAFRGADDLSNALRAGINVVLAASALTEAAEALARDAREALAECMWETGATGIRTAHHSASVAQAKPSVIITGDVAPQYMRSPAPVPDKSAIARALQAGEPVANARLSNGGAPTLTIRLRKE